MRDAESMLPDFYCGNARFGRSATDMSTSESSCNGKASERAQEYDEGKPHTEESGGGASGVTICFFLPAVNPSFISFRALFISDFTRDDLGEW